MSFSPLPDVFLTELRDASTGPVVELGGGDGRFTRILTAAGGRPAVVDRHRGEAFTLAPGILADAAAPPLRCVSMLVAGNLLHHLWRADARRGVVVSWIDCLAAGGRLYVFEDEPTAAPGPARNYRDLQALLARIVPWRRALLPGRDFERAVRAAAHPGVWTFGRMRNQFPAADRHDVLSLLADERGVTPDRVAALARRVAAEGIDYGEYWWARFERE
jgi:hypothetical protein